MWSNTMDWKVTITQTLVHRTQQDFNVTVMADGTRTLLNTMNDKHAAPEVQSFKFQRLTSTSLF